MASTATLEEKFHAAVKAIQRLPNDGKIDRKTISIDKKIRFL